MPAGSQPPSLPRASGRAPDRRRGDDLGVEGDEEAERDRVERRVRAGDDSESAGGEQDRGVLEKIWARPTCDVNGMLGGYTGTGAKTVLPARASAKISFRLVPDQDPEAAAEQFRAYLHGIVPAGCRWELIVHHGAPAIRVPTDSPYLRAAREALENAYGREALLIGCGGSIPVVGVMKEVLGIDSLLMGVGLDDDGMHSPNEKFEVTCFERGIKSHAALLEEFAAK